MKSNMVPAPGFEPRNRLRVPDNPDDPVLNEYIRGVNQQFSEMTSDQN